MESEIPTYRIAIIHGTLGSPESNWFPWLQHELQKLGHSVSVPQFPTPDNQNVDQWLEVFDREFGFTNLDQNCMLIGHSIGSAFMAHALQQAKTPIRASFFVAGFLGEIGIPEYDKLNSSFFEKLPDWEQIRNKAGRMFAYYSNEDPYVPEAAASSFTDRLQVRPTLIEDGGHLNSEAGYETFPLLLKDIQDISLPKSA